MKLYIQSYDAEKIILKREPFGCIYRIFPFVGIGMLALSIYLFFHAELYMVNEPGKLKLFSEPFGVIVGVLVFFGVVIVLVGGFLLPSKYNRTPKNIIFDHQRACMVVRMANRSEEGIVPYPDIKSFRIREQYKRDDNSRRGYYDYHILAEKKDGGEWSLVTAYTKEDADKILRFFTEDVPLHKQSTALPPVKTSPKISMTENGNISLITWSNPFSAGFFIILLFTLVVAPVCVLGFIQSGYNPMAILALIAPLVLIAITVSMFYKHTRKLAITINADALEYYEFSKITGKRSKLVSLPLEDIDQVVYKYLPAEVGISSDIWITTKQDTVKKSNLFSKLKSTDTELTLSLTSLNPVECLQLEGWLQQKINEKRKEKVK